MAWYGQGIGVEEPCEEVGSHYLVQSGTENHTSQYLLSLPLFFFLTSKVWQESTKETKWRTEWNRCNLKFNKGSFGLPQLPIGAKAADT